MNAPTTFLYTMRCAPHLVVAFTLVAMTGCAATRPADTGVAGHYVDSSRPSANAGVGIESNDIEAMTDQMMRDLMATPLIANAAAPPRVIIDDTRFINESNQVLNLSLVLDRLRIELMRASGGRILFVSRQNADLVEDEKGLKADGRVDGGANDTNQALAGADYRLIGKLASRSSFDSASRTQSNWIVVTFEMLDLNNGLSVWGNVYDFKKEGANDRIYH